ncbi:hypothetical protein Tco_0091659 [Tanacetum coccineum]
MQRFKVESRHVKGAHECMRIFKFMHGITNPEFIKRLHDNIPKSVDEMIRATTAFLMGEVAASNQARKKTPPTWKQQEVGRKQNFDRNGDFQNQQRSERRRDKFTLLSKSLREILALDKGRNLWERQSHGDPNGPAMAKGGQTKDHAKLFSRPINFVPAARLRSQVKRQMVPTTVPLIDFNGEIMWPIGQISLLLKIGDEEHFTSTLMNFMVVRSPSPYNGIIGRLGVRRIQAVPSTAHEMLKFLVPGGILTLRSIRIVPLECTVVSRPEAQPSDVIQAPEERIKVAIHLEYPEQTIVIGSTLTEEGRKALCDLLRHNLDIFAWKPADMTGVP